MSALSFFIEAVVVRLSDAYAVDYFVQMRSRFPPLGETTLRLREGEKAGVRMLASKVQAASLIKWFLSNPCKKKCGVKTNFETLSIRVGLKPGLVGPARGKTAKSAPGRPTLPYTTNIPGLATVQEEPVSQE